MTVHKFSKTLIESQLKTNPNSYKNAFEKLNNDRSKTTIKAKSKKLKKIIQNSNMERKRK